MATLHNECKHISSIKSQNWKIRSLGCNGSVRLLIIRVGVKLQGKFFRRMVFCVSVRFFFIPVMVMTKKRSFGATLNNENNPFFCFSNGPTVHFMLSQR